MDKDVPKDSPQAMLREAENEAVAKLKHVEAQASSVITKVEEGKIDTIDSNARYLAYLARLRPLLLPATRYLAYTSDVGEAFRPVVNPTAVRAAYGISWMYLVGDVAYEGFRATKEREARAEKRTALDRLTGRGIEDLSASTEVGLRVVKRATFQATASMLFPALTIHTTVKQSGRLFKNAKSPRVRAWGPTVLGLAVVPALPYIFDEPVEHGVDFIFNKIEKIVVDSASSAGKKTEL
ncbi:uncharacterized protein L969DRAFT_93985 [Mixia osmundae IAM 14324]|uniref:Mitochondrial fission process protein 1 n=1 Tax=Mixia osmundae (strain CBS 9802 / IAM 14324 / JCM 22182 / KY 12970) TaxID=764103 RepID=G7E8Q9_MIXOS|nr:uncharacterized protein L969DRAFT_93985 [Mixia osmundae IAM 14324]KEI40163.1 hypothetical protein L969DRAFT_93985 [Mixia osmundae IAM 14324]GAA99527.1 hypothetical protein E5Q_06228 [Mixia osmundae IAM 14324]